MRRGAVSTFQRWQFRNGRPNWSARALSRVLGTAFAAGIGPNQAATIEVRGRKTGRKISFPIVVVPYEADRYLVAMLGDKTNWVQNVRADDHAVLLQGRRENVSLVEDFSGNRAAILRRYLELAPGARPFFPIDRRAPLGDFQAIVDDYPVFRVAPAI
jgi:F420H(2)-dependent quinone reductase